MKNYPSLRHALVAKGLSFINFLISVILLICIIPLVLLLKVETHERKISLAYALLAICVILAESWGLGLAAFYCGLSNFIEPHFWLICLIGFGIEVIVWSISAFLIILEYHDSPYIH